MLLWVLVTLFAFSGVVNSAPPGPNKNGGQLVNPPNDVEEFVFSFEDNNNRGGITIPLDQQLSSLVKKLNDAKSDSLKITYFFLGIFFWVNFKCLIKEANLYSMQAYDTSLSVTFYT